MGSVGSEFCAVAPSPQLRARMREQLSSLQAGADVPLGLARDPRPLGFNDGVIRPPGSFPPGTSLTDVRSAAAERAPLRGDRARHRRARRLHRQAVRRDTAHFDDLFFSTGVIPTGSVTEYYTEVTDGLIDHHRRGRRALPHAADARLVRATATSASASRRATRAPTSWRTTPPTAADPTSTSRPTTTTATATSTRSSSCTPARAARRPATRRHLVAQVDAARGATTPTARRSSPT